MSRRPPSVSLPAWIGKSMRVPAFGADAKAGGLAPVGWRTLPGPALPRCRVPALSMSPSAAAGGASGLGREIGEVFRRQAPARVCARWLAAASRVCFSKRVAQYFDEVSDHVENIPSLLPNARRGRCARSFTDSENAAAGVAPSPGHPDRSCFTRPPLPRPLRLHTQEQTDNIRRLRRHGALSLYLLLSLFPFMP